MCERAIIVYARTSLDAIKLLKIIINHVVKGFLNQGYTTQLILISKFDKIY